MNNTNLYTFSSKLSSKTIQVHASNLNNKEDIDGLFDHHKLIIGSFENISFPVLFKQEYGEKLQDILDTGWPGLFLISDKMKTILEDNNLNGWKTFTVKVFDKSGYNINGYHGLSITGRCGKINCNKSKVIELKLVSDGPIVKFYKGMHVDLDKWDGSDFFLPEKNFKILITSKVVEILKNHQLTNVRFENLLDIETPIN